MGLHHWMMKHGIGSPGYIARAMANQYNEMKQRWPKIEEGEILRRVYVSRIAAQTIVGGPARYRESKNDPALIDVVVRMNPDLFSLIRCAALIEHPEFERPNAPEDRFEVLDRVVSEVLDEKVPGWKRAEPTLRVVDGSGFEDTSLLPMIWTAWHNGNHHAAFNGFGFKLSVTDRDLYFDRSWKSVTLALPVDTGFALTDANIEKESFWEDCRELITKDIGLWMMARNYAPWPKGLPPRFTAWVVGQAIFRVELYESKLDPRQNIYS